MDALTSSNRGFPAHAAAAAQPMPIRTVASAMPANPAAVKSPSDYLRALRRRLWMVLAVAVPMATLACTYVLRMKPVYQVRAEIEINVPEYDPAVSALTTHDISRREGGSHTNYAANRAMQLRSARLQRRVVSAEDLAAEVSQFEDPADELLSSLTVKELQRGGNTYIVTLDGQDPYRTKRLMEVLLREFNAEAREESTKRMESSRELAQGNLNGLEKELGELKLRIKAKLTASTTLGVGGKSLVEEQVVNLGTMLNQKQMRLGELNQQMLMQQAFPRLEHQAKDPELVRLEAERRRMTEMLRLAKSTARDFNNDPSARIAAKKLDEILDDMNELKNVRTPTVQSPTEMILEQYQREIEADKAQQADLLAEMRARLPEHQEMLDMLRESEDKAKRIANMKERLSEFGMLAGSPGVTDFIKVPASLPEPTVPIKPNKMLLIVAAIMASLFAGVGLVCVLEHIDHAVKVPEHVSHGLTLPLLGVVPRIRRTAMTQRGSHLWTPGSSDGLACDAYRNVRASLLGVTDRRGPIVTLLVTSAKAGEGKSTTALNLAATCALAGERTLLLDVDLRRPSLADVFIEDDDDGPRLGLVDVLKGEVPWQRTLRHTRIPNLDFMATGDTRGTPIEILGTLELRQLLNALSHHYDRVILDGPAVLGLADCRFLGRMVDASLLVVRAGSHQLMTLHRAKSMLEQSHVTIAGVVFNSLTEDMENWSSYYGGYGSLPSSERMLEGARG